MRRSWTFSIGGITNGTCTQCSAFNGTFELRYSDHCGYADWQSTPTPCTGNPFDPVGCRIHARWRLGSGSTELFYFLNCNVGNGFSSAVYRSPVATWNCNGPNVFTLNTSSGECLNYPASVTLFPGPNIVPGTNLCECQPPHDAIAANWQFSLAGLQEACEEMNGTWVLHACDELFCLGDRCYWIFRFPLDPPQYLAVLYHDSVTGRLTLRIGSDVGGHGHRIYWMPLTAFNPVGPNTLAQIVPDFSNVCGTPVNERCNPWPGAITIVPV